MFTTEKHKRTSTGAGPGGRCNTRPYRMIAGKYHKNDSFDRLPI